MEQINPEVLRQAKEELEAICQKHDIVLMPIVIHQGDRTISSIEIVPRSMMSNPGNPMVRTVSNNESEAPAVEEAPAAE
jgi:hypothetical protein